MKTKVIDLIIILLIYIGAFAIGYLSMMWVTSTILRFAFADAVATVVIYIVSLFFKNSSLYDPYWSFTPWVIATVFLIKYGNYSLTNIILYAAITFWSWRLTINWILNFTDFSYEDWRYKKFRTENKPFMFQIINFTGIMMVPTIWVYTGLVPALVLLKTTGENWLSLIGSAIIFAGTILEIIADVDMRNFLKTTKEKVTCQHGLWKYSRHPNYLGENMVWFGIYVALVVTIPSMWWLCVGTVIMILLFEFVSIPLMENRQKSRRSDYVDYIKHTQRMLILPRRK